ncbi:hypothetical protein M885DRAFT_253558 [Pelagophyceae sp. CCMP2097]|nr:hypothetical protein M885DRAFT_253558 [Pelagophyceae sp. CCMP2097]
MTRRRGSGTSSVHVVHAFDSSNRGSEARLVASRVELSPGPTGSSKATKTSRCSSRHASAQREHDLDGSYGSRGSEYTATARPLESLTWRPRGASKGFPRCESLMTLVSYFVKGPSQNCVSSESRPSKDSGAHRSCQLR